MLHSVLIMLIFLSVNACLDNNCSGLFTIFMEIYWSSYIDSCTPWNRLLMQLWVKNYTNNFVINRNVIVLYFIQQCTVLHDLFFIWFQFNNSSLTGFIIFDNISFIVVKPKVWVDQGNNIHSEFSPIKVVENDHKIISNCL